MATEVRMATEAPIESAADVVAGCARQAQRAAVALATASDETIDAALHAMAQRMAADGFPVDPGALLDDLPQHASAGRPHLARALVSAGVVCSVDEAFRQYLVTGGRYYTGRADTDVSAAVRMVRAAGGVPVLAHAMARRRGPVVGPGVITELAAEGLAGLEVDHPDHTGEDRATLRDLAAALDLLITGSSDYHGANKTAYLGQESTDPKTLERLEELAARSCIAAVGG